jgi:hypothetical protein
MEALYVPLRIEVERLKVPLADASTALIKLLVLAYLPYKEVMP